MTLQFAPIVDLNFTDKRRALSAGFTNGTVLNTPANYLTEAALDARLTAISGTTYSANELLKMTLNDKIYAVRFNDDLAGV